MFASSVKIENRPFHSEKKTCQSAEIAMELILVSTDQKYKKKTSSLHSKLEVHVPSSMPFVCVQFLRGSFLRQFLLPKLENSNV